MDWRPHIVVVEDEAAGRQLLIGYLSKRGYRVTGFASGVGLRRLVEREIPNLVLLDIGLPGEDGLVLARWLREKSSKICIIMVTAAGETVDRIVGLEIGRRRLHPQAVRAARAAGAHQERAAPYRRGAGRGADQAHPHGPAHPRPRAAHPDRGRRQRGDAVSQRVRPAEAVRRQSEPAARAELDAGADRPSRDGGLRPSHRPAHQPHPPQDRGRPRAPDGDSHRLGRRLHVRAAAGLPLADTGCPVQRKTTQ